MASVNKNVKTHFAFVMSCISTSGLSQTPDNINLKKINKKKSTCPKSVTFDLLKLKLGEWFKICKTTRNRCTRLKPRYYETYTCDSDADTDLLSHCAGFSNWDFMMLFSNYSVPRRPRQYHSLLDLKTASQNSCWKTLCICLLASADE